MAVLLFSLPALAATAKKTKKPVKQKKTAQSEYFFKTGSGDAKLYRFDKNGDPIVPAKPKAGTKNKKAKNKSSKKIKKPQPKKQTQPAVKKKDTQQESFEEEISGD